MAGENRMSTHDLKQQLETAAYRFDFFEALRLIETWYPQHPRLGTGLKAEQDPIRLAQDPEMDFAASSIARFSPGEHSVLAVNFMGLFGPHGPLPLHLTEYARERLRHHHDPTIARFADIFHHRMISLFYRAWANTRPTVCYDRPESDRFGFYIGSLLGISGSAFQNRDALADRAKLHYAAHFAGQTKHPEGLKAIIADILKVPVAIKEFVGEWMPIHFTEQTRLGWSADLASLGQSAVIGQSVWSCQHKFTLVLGPMPRRQYLALLPGGAALAQLAAIVRNYVGDEYVWDAQLLLEAAEVPAELALGRSPQATELSMNGAAQLGWSMWLGSRRSSLDADDLLLNPYISKVVA
jgi:type VI secretion system protein ImpH